MQQSLCHHVLWICGGFVRHSQWAVSFNGPSSIMCVQYLGIWQRLEVTPSCCVASALELLTAAAAVTVLLLPLLLHLQVRD